MRSRATLAMQALPCAWLLPITPVPNGSERIIKGGLSLVGPAFYIGWSGTGSSCCVTLIKICHRPLWERRPFLAEGEGCAVSRLQTSLMLTGELS
jgi:hypothetical protein